MKVFVVFDFPGIDPDCEDADMVLDILEDELYDFANDCGYGSNWWIEDVTEDNNA